MTQTYVSGTHAIRSIHSTDIYIFLCVFFNIYVAFLLISRVYYVLCGWSPEMMTVNAAFFVKIKIHYIPYVFYWDCFDDVITPVVVLGCFGLWQRAAEPKGGHPYLHSGGRVQLDDRQGLL